MLPQQDSNFFSDFCGILEAQQQIQPAVPHPLTFHSKPVLANLTIRRRPTHQRWLYTMNTTHNSSATRSTQLQVNSQLDCRPNSDSGWAATAAGEADTYGGRDTAANAGTAWGTAGGGRRQHGTSEWDAASNVETVVAGTTPDDWRPPLQSDRGSHRSGGYLLQEQMTTRHALSQSTHAPEIDTQQESTCCISCLQGTGKCVGRTVLGTTACLCSIPAVLCAVGACLLGTAAECASLPCACCSLLAD